MSVNVLVIPEDFRKDQYVLKPIVEKLFESMGVSARVIVCKDPLLGGVGEALKWERLEEILVRYRGMIKVFLLLLDRDCDQNRVNKLAGLEEKARKFLATPTKVLLAQDAWQEVEVWVLAGLLELPKRWTWKDIRAECDPKEKYFDKVVADRGLQDAPYQGRGRLANEAARNYARIRALCDEDVGRLEQRIREALEESR